VSIRDSDIIIRRYAFVFLISGLLTSVGKASREALLLKESTKIVENLSVNSRCNSIYKNIVSTPFVLVIEPIKDKK